VHFIHKTNKARRALLRKKEKETEEILTAK